MWQSSYTKLCYLDPTKFPKLYHSVLLNFSLIEQVDSFRVSNCLLLVGFVDLMESTASQLTQDVVKMNDLQQFSNQMKKQKKVVSGLNLVMFVVLFFYSCFQKPSFHQQKSYPVEICLKNQLLLRLKTDMFLNKY